MSTLFFDTPPLVAVAVIFGLSLGGAYVLFRTLKATAVMKTVRGQAGGALAGFLMVFSALGGTYLKLLPGAEDLDALRADNARLEARVQELQDEILDFERRTEAEVWTLVGEVLPTDGPPADQIEVVMMPLPRRESARPHGSFRFEHLEIVNGVWPEIEVSAAGYYPESRLLTEDQLDLYPERKLAKLRKPVELWGERTDATVVASTFEDGQESTSQTSGS